MRPKVKHAVILIWRRVDNDIEFLIENNIRSMRLPNINGTHPILKDNTDLDLSIPISSFIKDVGFLEFTFDDPEFLFEGIDYERSIIMFSYNTTYKQNSYGFHHYYFVKLNELAKYEIRCSLLLDVVNKMLEMQKIYKTFELSK